MPGGDDLDEKIEQLNTLAAIGDFIVCAGHLEATICRVIDWMQGSLTPGAISYETRRLRWNKLVQRLLDVAQGHGRGDEVGGLLREFELDQAMKFRHSIVHGQVGVNGSGVHIVRRPVDGSGDHIPIGSRADLVGVANRIRELNQRLDLLLPEEFRRVSVNLVAGVVGLTRERAIVQGLDPDRPSTSSASFGTATLPAGPPASRTIRPTELSDGCPGPLRCLGGRS